MAGFTARWLDALKAKGKTPEEHFEPDADYRGLAIRVAPSGPPKNLIPSKNVAAE